MRRALVAQVFLFAVSLLLLSVLSSILTGYSGSSNPPETPKRPESPVEEESPIFVFKATPVPSQKYWSIYTSDFYTGSNWLRTTSENSVKEFPTFQDANATEVVTVEVNATGREILLPTASPHSLLSNMSSTPSEELSYYVDPIANVSKIRYLGQAETVKLNYQVSWRSVEIDDGSISYSEVTEEILGKYLQLPSSLPAAVYDLAQSLQDPSYSVYDQILADVQYLRTNFVYDIEHSKRLYERIQQGSNVYSYLRQKKGLCLDAATALAIVLRIQEIPARISVGFKPERIENGWLLYYTSGAHAVTEAYLPPCGWVQFDATPPLERNPLVKVDPFKRESSPGSRLFFHISITNRRNLSDDFDLFAHSGRGWTITTAPRKLTIKALQTSSALLEVIVADDANFGEKDVVTITAASTKSRDTVFSILAIVQVDNAQLIETTTTLESIDETSLRGNGFWVNGTVYAADDQPVENMSIFVFLTKTTPTNGVIVGRGYSEHGSFKILSTIPNLSDPGYYNVIAVSTGSLQLTPSDNARNMKVLATTRVELYTEGDFLLGYGAIYGRLLWDNGDGFATAPISLQITSLETLSTTWKYDNLTLKDGSFRIPSRFPDAGLYETKVVYLGSEFVLGSNATKTANIRLGTPTINILSDRTAVRGEVFNVTGTIQFEDVGVWGEPITVTLDELRLGTVETTRNGLYEWSFLVDSEESLGHHTVTVSLARHNLSTVHQIAVKSKVTLDTKASEIAGGMLISFSPTLLDDHNQPIQGAEIRLDNYGLSVRTGKDENQSFLLNNIELWPENLVLATSFSGSEHYLPATAQVEISIEPTTSLAYFLPLVSPPLAIAVFIYVKNHARKRQPPQQIYEAKVVRQQSEAWEVQTHGLMETQPLKILLVGIEAGLPSVCSINESLCIEVALDKEALKTTQNRIVEVFMNEEDTISLCLSDEGCARFSHVFAEKGEHRLWAIMGRSDELPPWKTEIELRVIEYGEEIVRLYNEFAKKLFSHGIQARNEMTAREIENLVLSTRDFDDNSLGSVTACFEKAQYSNHSVTRSDYARMYLSLRGLDLGVE